MKKINRVRKAQEFQKLIKSGTKLVNGSFVMYFRPKAEPAARVGITLSGKIGNAVERNKIKRQTRMMCQDVINFQTFPFDVILIIRFSYKNLSYEANKKNLEKLVSKATMDRRIFNKLRRNGINETQSQDEKTSPDQFPGTRSGGSDRMQNPD